MNRFSWTYLAEIPRALAELVWLMMYAPSRFSALAAPAAVRARPAHYGARVTGDRPKPSSTRTASAKSSSTSSYSAAAQLTIGA
jgi:hypothetical protein